MFGQISKTYYTVSDIRKQTNSSQMVDDNVKDDFERYFGMTSGQALTYFLLLHGQLYYLYECNTAVEFTAYGSTVFNLNKNKYSAMYDSVNLEYNPIHNYNMTEIGTDTMTGNTMSNTNGTDRTDNNTSTQTTTNVTDNGTSTEGVTSYDRVSFKDASKTTSTNTAEGGGLTKNTGNITVTSNSDTTSDRNDTSTHNLTRTGNIGVTTSQKMLNDELDLIPRKQLIFEYFKDYMDMLCISIYK